MSRDRDTTGRRIAVLVAAHNRREATLAALRALATTALDVAGVHVFLVDDASTDGTSEAVRAEFPDATVIPGTGTLFWNGGMALAQRHVPATGYDYQLWLNDDVELLPDALSKLLSVAERHGNGAIVVGAVTGSTGQITYSGFRRAGPSPQRLQLVPPGPEPVEVDTMNGNVVLIPAETARRIGPIDSRYTHRYGDLDYGYRARQLGISVVLAPGTVGHCEANTAPAPHLAPGLSLRQRLRTLTGPKYLPVKDQVVFSRSHGGALWPAFVVSPYLTLARRHLFRRVGINRLDR